MEVKLFLGALTVIFLSFGIVSNSYADIKDCDKKMKEADRLANQGAKSPAKKEYVEARNCYARHGNHQLASKANSKQAGL